MKTLKLLLSIFNRPSAQSIRQSNLEDYQRELIGAEASAAYSTKLAEFYREGIVRLQEQIRHE